MSLSTNCTSPSTPSRAKSTVFLNAFATLLDILPEVIGPNMGLKSFSEIQAMEWIKHLVEYNVPTGKLLRGQIVELVFEALVTNPSEDELKTARIMGWCVELLQASFLIADDIMDNGVTRRGKPCWYMIDNLGNGAINDSFILEHLAYQLVKKYLKNTKAYSDVVDLFHDVTWKTVLGQNMDLKCCRERRYETFTSSLYNDIVKYKTAYYTFYLPVNLAVILAKKRISDSDMNSINHALLALGKLFQVQDDYFDCFVNETIVGKKGSDIQEGKCTWLFVTARQSCKDPKQLSLLEENYGYLNPTKVAMVVDIYRCIGLKQKFLNEQEHLYNEIRKLIKQISCKMLQNVVLKILELVYKRTN